MLITFTYRSPLLFTSSIKFSPKSLKNPNFKPYFSILHLNSPPMSSSSSSIIAEYAKSKRSTCKTCSNAIDAASLRLGVVTKEKGKAYDMTKWHHFKCLSFDSLNVPSVESIRGFDSLKSDDQEAVKKVVEEHSKVNDIDEAVPSGDKPKSAKRKKNKDRDDVVDAEEEQIGSKRLKLSEGEEAKDKVEIKLATSDIKDSYKDARLLPKWKAFHTIIFLEKDDGLKDSSKIAAFDFDGCLAKTDVKRTGAEAWSLMFKSIPDKMQKLYNDGYKLVIYTNESNIERWKNQRQKAVDSKVGRLNNFINRVKVPIQVFIACGFGGTDPYRKPKTGMWHVMEQHFNSGIPIDMDHSFYVGDAAGRKTDHSNADIKFAQDIGLKFYLPEEYFTDAC